MASQRPVSISHSIVIEAKQVHKAGKKSSCSAILTVGELYGCGLTALAYQIKTYEILFCELFGQVYLYIRKFAPMKLSHYIIINMTCF